jgi:acetyl-CoA synthetase
VLAPGHAPAPGACKYAREIEFVTDLPRTIPGKIRRTELRQLERERARPR